MPNSRLPLPDGVGDHAVDADAREHDARSTANDAEQRRLQPALRRASDRRPRRACARRRPAAPDRPTRIAPASAAPIAAGSLRVRTASAMRSCVALLVREIDLRPHVLVEAIVADVPDDADDPVIQGRSDHRNPDAAPDRIGAVANRLRQPLVDDRHRRRVSRSVSVNARPPSSGISSVRK